MKKEISAAIFTAILVFFVVLCCLNSEIVENKRLAIAVTGIYFAVTVIIAGVYDMLATYLRNVVLVGVFVLVLTTLALLLSLPNGEKIFFLTSEDIQAKLFYSAIGILLTIQLIIFFRFFKKISKQEGGL